MNTIALSPDGKKVLSGSNDDAVRLWDNDKTIVWRCIRPIIIHAHTQHTYTQSSASHTYTVYHDANIYSSGLYTTHTRSGVHMGVKV
jgi:WD40 repeat protein